MTCEFLIARKYSIPRGGKKLITSRSNLSSKNPSVSKRSRISEMFNTLFGMIHRAVSSPRWSSETALRFRNQSGFEMSVIEAAIERSDGERSRCVSSARARRKESQKSGHRLLRKRSSPPPSPFSKGLLGRAQRILSRIRTRPQRISTEEPKE